MDGSYRYLYLREWGTCTTAMTSTGIERQDISSPRYEYGGDDYVFVELSEEMSFDANGVA